MQQPQTRYARSGELHIAYQVIGEGPLTVVWIPGFVSNVELAWSEPLFVRVIERLSSFARLIMFDKRGTGLSDPFVGAPTMEERMDDVRAVMDDVGVERAAIYGVSEGGPMACVFAATYPERVSHLVLYGTFAAGPKAFLADCADEPPELIASVHDFALALAEMKTAVYGHWGEGRSLDLFAPSVARRPLERRFWATWERQGASPAMARSIVGLLDDTDVRSVLPVISAPTLVMHQQGDRTVPRAQGERIASGIPGARVALAPGIDHAPFRSEDTDALGDEMEAFLTGTEVVHTVQNRLTTVLFTDIVDSTRQAAAEGDEGWGRTVDAHDELMRSLLSEFGGREVKTMGDGFLATFEGPRKAIDCARRFAEQVEPLGIEVRAGIHTGECSVTIDDVRGLTVNIAARVCSLAGGGQIAITGTVADLLIGSGVAFTDFGRHELKGVPGEWTLRLVGDVDTRPSEPLPTSTPATNLSGRALSVVGMRFPRVARAGVRGARVLSARAGRSSPIS